MRNAVDTLYRVFTAFSHLEKYAVLFSAGYKTRKRVAFRVARFWKRPIENQCDSATEITFRFCGFGQVCGIVRYFAVVSGVSMQ